VSAYAYMPILPVCVHALYFLCVCMRFTSCVCVYSCSRC
jgi:hypothetical protein